VAVEWVWSFARDTKPQPLVAVKLLLSGHCSASKQFLERFPCRGGKMTAASFSIRTSCRFTKWAKPTASPSSRWNWYKVKTSLTRARQAAGAGPRRGYMKMIAEAVH